MAGHSRRLSPGPQLSAAILAHDREVAAIELSLQSRVEGSWTVLDVQGDVDVYTAPSLRERVNQLVDQESYKILVNLQRVEFLDSTGLSVLVAGLTRVREHGGTLRLTGAKGAVLRVLTITGLDQVFPIYEDVAQATSS